jgi:hypothetical protein
LQHGDGRQAQYAKLNYGIALLYFDFFNFDAPCAGAMDAIDYVVRHNCPPAEIGGWPSGNPRRARRGRASGQRRDG